MSKDKSTCDSHTHKSTVVTSVPAINRHLKRIFGDNEPATISVVKQYLITAVDLTARSDAIKRDQVRSYKTLIERYRNPIRSEAARATS